MAGYPYVNKVEDPSAKSALTNAFDLIASLTARVEALEAAALTATSGVVDAQGARVANVATPQAETDAATVGFVRQLIEAQVETF
jgi:hypothetical protein